MTNDDRRPKWRAERIDGETYVKMADLLAWLRDCEEEWKGCRDADPSKVAEHLADAIRDSWMESDRPRMIGGDA